MELLFLIIASVTCLFLILTILEFTIGFHKIRCLSRQASLEPSQLPMVSIIFSALNEEKDIEATISAMLKLNYPAFEIIAINDRSTDRTGDLLNRLQQQHPKHVHALHIEQLPKGWLGKNHALHLGAQHAKGQWLLFTDADAHMKPDLLTKAMSYTLTKHLDHLTILEHHLRHTFWLNVFFLAYYVCYTMAMKPWRIRYAWSKKSLGHGAFNLVKKQSYDSCHGHQTIAMECLDDLKFGQMIKQHGFLQDTVDGRDFLERQWYGTTQEMIAGLKKNSFAYSGYRLLHTLSDIVFALMLYLWPILAVILFSGTLFWLNVVNIALTLAMCAYVAGQFRLEKRYAWFYPAAILLLIYTVINSVIATYTHQGVVWRGTHYSLKDLKKQTDTTQSL